MANRGPDRYDVIVVGAGAAGIVAAWRAASLGVRVLLLEKNERIGTKILISGGGKCNITHDGPIESLLAAFRPNEGRFLRPACYRFTNRDIIEMLTGRGLTVTTRADGRIFPMDGAAKDVVAILGQYIGDSGVDTRLRSGVTGIEADEHGVSGVRIGKQMIPSRRVAIAVGGSSYPGAGTTGDGWPWARDLGHSIVRIRAALAPIFFETAPPAEWPGVALRDCLLRARQNGKEITRWRGDMLFTHRGVSGPTVLGISRVVAERQREGAVILEADLMPDQSFENVAATVRDWAGNHPRREVGALIEPLVPNRLVAALLSAAGVPKETTGAYLGRKEQNRLVAVLKGWQVGKVEHVPLEKGEVVAGGIALDEVDPQTMRSRVVKGLYLCGEVLDIAGPVGGYNLQAAFSTGFVAGETAAKDSLSTGFGI